MNRKGFWAMEEKYMKSFQLVMEMLENNELPMEEEVQLRELVYERESRRAEKRIAYDLLGYLQKEVRHEGNLGRVPASQDRAEVSDGFGEALSQARIQSGITQQQLAGMTGINQGDISRIERGFSNPSLATMKRLADGLGMGLNIDFI